MTPINSLFNQDNDVHFQNQMKMVRMYLWLNVATAAMVAKATGVPHKNICRYKRELEKAGLLKVVYQGICEATGFRASYLTTNPTLIDQAAKEI